jgi:hypothetical protein
MSRIRVFVLVFVSSAFGHCDQTARAARQCEIDRISGAPTDCFAGQKLPVAVEKNRMGLRISVNIDTDRATIVAAGSMLDLEGAAAHT